MSFLRFLLKLTFIKFISKISFYDISLTDTIKMFKAHIKLSVLKELNKKKLSGYDLIKHFEEFGERPSPGYIYPLLNDLEEKGFISVKQDERRKVYSITAKGKKLLLELQKNREEMINKMKKVWSSITDKDEVNQIVKNRQRMFANKDSFKDKDILEKFHKTLFSVYKTGKDKRQKIRTILNKTIKEIRSLK